MKLLLSALLPILAAAATSKPTVTIDAGTLTGGQCQDASAVYYKSIPYAEPPLGELRFESPVAKKQFSGGKLDATSTPPACIQWTSEFNETTAESEDCLFLDVWTPSDATKDSKLPVRVWIYGGSNTNGGISNTLYDGCNSADQGAVLVSINYRLGPLGFMALEKAGIYGNQGIQDLVLGLEWVQDNIAEFGGDPNKVNLFGQSAGAEDAFIISSLPKAPQLINSFISESGGGKNLVTKATLQTTGANYASILGCGSSKSCLQAKSASELLKAYAKDGESGYMSYGIGVDGAIGVTSAHTHTFYPYVDGKVIPQEPISRGSRVPAIFGFNLNEGVIYAGSTCETNETACTEAGYGDFLKANYGPMASTVEKYYPLSKFVSLGDKAVLGAISKVITDSDYMCPGFRGAIATARNNVPTWAYEFIHNTTCAWMETVAQDDVSELGATHTAEISYVFGNMAFDLSGRDSCNSTAAEYHLSNQMVSLWQAMAENAAPSTDAIKWPRFQPSKNGTTPGLFFANSIGPGTIDFSACQLWDKVNTVLSATTNSTSSESASGTAKASSTANASGTAKATSSPTHQIGSAGTILPGGLLALSVLLLHMTVFV
ncbi:hypothetical protein N7481_007734 [Penicillium waksmanii]|uniref:uncharacterized protein n=1 Tax=Penicillium waksmanii TaxID=69791 RepID=UPI0025484872|nr:uncharacterized protein N7481_007734 [Penicillium waksmanii]KAJ5980436.1 hypothetical protein N7481_007734 [Penicillium waksmanii]